jgi:hypothetical protein
VLREGNQFPLDGGRENAQDGLVRWMDAQGRSGKDETRRQGRNVDAGEVAISLKRRPMLCTATDGLPILIQGADTNPVIERLQGKVQVFVGFELEDGEAARPIEGEQIEHTPVTRGECGNLGVEQIAAQVRQDLVDVHAEPRFEPSFRLQPEECIGVGAIWIAAKEQAREQLAAERLVVRGERRFVGSRAEGDFLFAANEWSAARCRTRANSSPCSGRPVSLAERAQISTRPRCAAGTNCSSRSTPARHRSIAAEGAKACTSRVSMLPVSR